ncbi:hypothetical protein AYO38_03445 [bacterium SCGC AG-212-C10]|nr:hypothetical protein AYO38_03445 [bacterium SCGC AG-212-C10]
MTLEAPAEALGHAPKTATSRPRSASVRIVRNVMVLGVGQAAAWISATGLAVLLPRSLGASNLGRFTLAFSFVEVFSLIASFGVGSYLTKEVARHGGSDRSLVLNALLLRMPLALLAALLAASVATLLRFDAPTRNLVYLFSINLVLFAFGGVFASALSGLQELSWLTGVTALSRFVLLVLVVLVLALGLGATGVALAWTLTTGFTACASGLLARRFRLLAGTVRMETWVPMLRGGLPYLVWETSLLLYGRADILLLSLFTSVQVLGWYGAAYRIILIPAVIPGIIVAAIFPALSAARGDKAAFNAVARHSINVVNLLLIPCCVGIFVLAHDIVNVMGYPDSFSRTVTLMMILAIHVPLVGIDMVLGICIIAMDRQRLWAFTGVAAVTLNIGLNLLAIPLTQSMYGNGAIGASVVTCTTELFMMVVGIILLRRDTFEPNNLAVAIKCIGASLLMAAVVLIARGVVPFFGLIALGALVYASASMLLGAFDAKDLRQCWALALNRVREPQAGAV